MESPANERNSNAVASSPAHVWLRYPRQEIPVGSRDRPRSRDLLLSLCRRRLDSTDRSASECCMRCDARADRGLARPSPRKARFQSGWTRENCAPRNGREISVPRTLCNPDPCLSLATIFHTGHTSATCMLAAKYTHDPDDELLLIVAPPPPVHQQSTIIRKMWKIVDTCVHDPRRRLVHFYLCAISVNEHPSPCSSTITKHTLLPRSPRLIFLRVSVSMRAETSLRDNSRSRREETLGSSPGRVIALPRREEAFRVLFALGYLLSLLSAGASRLVSLA